MDGILDMTRCAAGRILLIGITATFLGCGRADGDSTELPVLPVETYPGVGFVEAGDSDCSGVLLSPTLVLTAAHCVDGNRGMAAIAFSLDPRPRVGRGTGYAPAKRIEIHPQYNQKDDGNPGVDVAVIELGSTAYGPVPNRFPRLADERALKKGEVLYNVGYGENYDGSSGLKRAKEVRFSELHDLPIVGGTVLSGLVVVTRGSKGEIGCSGDSGSPLMGEQSGVTRIFGVYSTSEEGNDLKTPEKSECRKGIAFGNYVAPSAFAGWLQKFLAPK